MTRELLSVKYVAYDRNTAREMRLLVEQFDDGTLYYRTWWNNRPYDDPTVTGFMPKSSAAFASTAALADEVLAEIHARQYPTRDLVILGELSAPAQAGNFGRLLAAQMQRV